MAIFRAGVDLDLSGLEELKSVAQQRLVTLAGVRAAAKVIAAAAKARAPRRPGSGALKRSIGQKSAKGKKGKSLAFAVVGARTAVQTLYKGRKTVPANYAHLVEKGARPHSLRTRAASRTGKAQVFVAGKGRMHPGARPKPFLRPAFDATKGRAGEAGKAAMAAALQKAIARAAARLAAKAKG